jgi:hypothetical protein
LASLIHLNVSIVRNYLNPMYAAKHCYNAKHLRAV